MKGVRSKPVSNVAGANQSPELQSDRSTPASSPRPPHLHAMACRPTRPITRACRQWGEQLFNGRFGLPTLPNTDNSDGISRARLKASPACVTFEGIKRKSCRLSKHKAFGPICHQDQIGGRRAVGFTRVSWRVKKVYGVARPGIKLSPSGTAKKTPIAVLKSGRARAAVESHGAAGRAGLRTSAMCWASKL